MEKIRVKHRKVEICGLTRNQQTKRKEKEKVEISRRLEQSRCPIGIIGIMIPTFGGQDPLQGTRNLNKDHPGIFRIQSHSKEVIQGDHENDTSPWISTILKTLLLTVVRQEGLGLQVRPAWVVYLSSNILSFYRWLKRFLKNRHQSCLLVQHSLDLDHLS